MVELLGDHWSIIIDVLVPSFAKAYCFFLFAYYRLVYVSITERYPILRETPILSSFVLEFLECQNLPFKL